MADDDARRMLDEYYGRRIDKNPNLDPTGYQPFPTEPPPLPDRRASIERRHRPGDLGQEEQEQNAAELGENMREGRGSGAAGNLGQILSAFIGARAPGLSKRSITALARAQALKADPATAPTEGGRTLKAWMAGGKSGGWDQIPARMGPDGKPEMEWARNLPAFDPNEPMFTQQSGLAGSSYSQPKGWFGYPKERAKGRLGDLVNLNPEILKSFPELADVPTKLERSGSMSPMRGGYRPPGWLLGEKLFGRGWSNNDLKETLGHEIDHWLANKQGWESGSNPSVEKRPWISKEEAFNRYEKNPGETRARFAMNADLNKPYAGYEYLPEFPAYEYPRDPEGNPIPGKRGRSVERKYDGMRPQQMPPSWQLDRSPEDMRNMSSIPASLAANVPWSMAKWYLGAKALGKAYDWLTEPSAAEKAAKEDEGKAFAEPPKPIDKADPMNEYLQGRGEHYGSDASSARLSQLLHGGIGATNVLGAVAKGMGPVLRGINLVSGGWNAASIASSQKERNEALQRQAEMERAQQAWNDLELPARDQGSWPDYPKP